MMNFGLRGRRKSAAPGKNLKKSTQVREMKMQIRFRSNLSLLFFLGIFVLAGGLVDAGTNISNSPGVTSTGERITADPLGNIHVVWAEYYSSTTGDAFYAKFDVLSQQWSTPLNISATSQVHSGENEQRPVGIDSDPYGNVYVTYLNKAGKKVMLRILQGGVWGTPFEVATNAGDGDTTRVAVDGSGNIFITWWDMSNYRCFSRARIGGVWESVKLLSTSQAKYPDIAVGNSLVFCAYTQKNSSGMYQIYYNQRGKTFDAPWTTSQLLAPHALKQQVPCVEIDSNEVPHIVWTPVYDDGNRTVRYSYWTGSGFSAPVDISAKQLLHYPALCERGNNLYCDWQVGGYGGGSSINYNHRISGTWNGEGLVPASSGGSYCDIAVSPAQDKAYYVYDSNGEIFFHSQVLFVAAPPPNYESYVIGDFDGDGEREAAVDFGTSGLMYWNDDAWSRLTPDNADGLLTSDVDNNNVDELIGDFGGLGLWVWVSATWHQISPVNADALVAGNVNGNGGGQVVVDFGSVGLWVWDGFGWTMLTGANPESMICSDLDGSGDDEIAVDFGSLGLWARGDGAWSQLSGANADALTSGNTDGYGGKELIGDFGSLGLWLWSAGTWFLVSSYNPEVVISADVDGNGADDLVGDFGSVGMWLWSNNSWTLMSYSDSQSMLTADTDGNGDKEVVVDFGTLGLWFWDSGTWSLMYAADAEDVAALDLDGDGDDEVLADFGIAGLWMWNGGVWSPVSW